VDVHEIEPIQIPSNRFLHPGRTEETAWNGARKIMDTNAVPKIYPLGASRQIGDAVCRCGKDFDVYAGAL
jgi:hypothetical protein